MDADVFVNKVAFEVRIEGRLQTLIGEAQTRSRNGVALSWAMASADSGAQPADVRQVYSEWEPSPEDTVFLETTFPRAAISYSFARPEADDEAGWETALREAEATVERSVGRKWWQLWK